MLIMIIEIISDYHDKVFILMIYSKSQDNTVYYTEHTGVTYTIKSSFTVVKQESVLSLIII